MGDVKELQPHEFVPSPVWPETCHECGCHKNTWIHRRWAPGKAVTL